MIDLHCHTWESDGTDSPRALLELAEAEGLEALAITDHDTFAGYDQVRESAGLRLLCGLELSTRLTGEADARSRSCHVLGYFPNGAPTEFRGWVEGLRGKRRERNVRMAARLAALGAAVTIEEVEALGRSITGRPHFARVLLAKGLVATHQEAFDRYVGEQAPAYVEREDPSAEQGIARIRSCGGVASLAHPVRLNKRDPQEEERLVAALCAAGLQAIEVWHSDHSEADVERYAALARKFGLVMTGGSDYHGSIKPHVRLGSCGAALRTLDDLDRLAARG